MKGRSWLWVPPTVIFLIFFWGAVMLAITSISLLHA
jgi:hypothetical protein